MANSYTKAQIETNLVGTEANSPTLSTKVLYAPVRSAELKPNPKHLSRTDEARGVDEPVQDLAEAYDPTWEEDCRMYPDVLGFELCPLLGMPVTTAGNGVITDPDATPVPAGAYRHVWTAPYGPSGASPLTAERIFAWKDENFFAKAKGCATSQFSIESPASGGVGIKFGGPANYATRISDPALTPAYEALTVAPFERAHLTIPTWMGSTAIPSDLTLQCASPVDQDRSMGIASRFPDIIEKGDDPIMWTGSIPKRHIATADWDALMNATGFAAKIRWQSTIAIVSAYKYALWFEGLNLQYNDGAPDALQNRRRHGASFDWKATYAGVAGSTKITLVNSTASYA